MKKHFKLLVVTAVAASIAAAAGIASQTAIAAGTTDTGYVCAPGVYGTPMTALATDTSVFPSWDSFAPGLWSPFAEKSIPTGAVVGDYYLTCTQGAGWTQVGRYVLGGGELTTENGPNPYLVNSLPIPGVYPVIEPAVVPAS